MRFQFIIGILLGQVCAYSQTFVIKGRVMECFQDIYDKNDKDTKYTVSIIDYYNKQKTNIETDSLGNFEYKNIIKGRWEIIVSGVSEISYHTPDTVIDINGEVSNLIFCIDKLYRPISKADEDTMRAKAKRDIETGQMKIYKFTAWDVLTDKDPLARTNRKVKKYKLKVMLIGCFRFSNRAEIEDYLAYRIYNAEISTHLDKRYGTRWRKKAKYTEEE